MEIKILDSNMKTIKAKTIDKSALTSDCWTIQFWGIEACSPCELLGKTECGGVAIRAKIKAGTFPVDGLPDVSQGEKS